MESEPRRGVYDKCAGPSVSCLQRPSDREDCCVTVMFLQRLGMTITSIASLSTATRLHTPCGHYSRDTFKPQRLELQPPSSRPPQSSTCRYHAISGNCNSGNAQASTPSPSGSRINLDDSSATGNKHRSDTTLSFQTFQWPVHSAGKSVEVRVRSGRRGASSDDLSTMRRYPGVRVRPFQCPTTIFPVDRVLVFQINFPPRHDLRQSGHCRVAAPVLTHTNGL